MVSEISGFGGMASLPRWFLWELTWNDTKQKYTKIPVGAQGQQISQTNPANWLSCDDAIVALAMLGQVPSATKTYALGFYYTAQPCGYWFYDIDGCIDPVTGEMNLDGREALARFPGAAWEISTSGRGIHILGRGEIPKHDKISRSSPGHELYDASHQIAFGFGYGEQVRGDVDLVWPVEHMARLVSEKFAPISSAPAVLGGWVDQAQRDVALSEVTPEVIDHLRSALKHLAAQGHANSGQYEAWDTVRQNLIGLGDTGFDLFVEFSNLGDKPSDHEALRKKFYEAGGGNKSTHKSIFHRAGATGWVNPRSHTAGALDRALATTPVSKAALLEAYRTRINGAETPEMLYTIAGDIAADNNTERTDKENPIARMLLKTFKTFGIEYGINDIRRMINPRTIFVADPSVDDYQRDDNGMIKVSQFNVTRAIALRGGLREDLFTVQTIIDDRLLRDTDYTRLTSLVEQIPGFPTPVSVNMIKGAIKQVAEDNGFDSAKDWASGLSWDGVNRVETFLVRSCHLEDTKYHRALSRYMWTAMAGRVLCPGVKADMVPILIGEEGIRKSTFVKSLVPNEEYFGTLDMAAKTDDISRRVVGKIVMEWDEMHGLKTRSKETILSFVTQSGQAWTPKYVENERKYPRRCLFIGTTNDDSPLPTYGKGRRWLPFRVEKAIDIDGIISDRDQLWAEACALFLANGVEFAAADHYADAVRGDYRSSDLMEQYVLSFLDAQPPIKFNETNAGAYKFTKFSINTLKHWISENTRHRGNYNDTEISIILQKLNYKKYRTAKANYWEAAG